jgi:hypothetical protein
MGYYFLFEINQALLRKEMQSTIQNGSIRHTIIKISNERINLEIVRVDDKEILYQEKLYDVISERKEGTNTILCCVHDEKEESLLGSFKKLSKNKHLLSLSENLIQIALPEIQVENIPKDSSTFHYPDHSDFSTSLSVDPLKPPPRQA